MRLSYLPITGLASLLVITCGCGGGATGNALPGQGEVPTILSITPAEGPTTGDVAVTLTGTNFRSGATVSFGPNAATSVVVVSENTIHCLTPAGSSGAVTVSVTNSDATKGLLPDAFTYTTAGGGNGGGGGSGGNAINGLPASVFGFQCGTGVSTNCPDWTWPKTSAQPGLIRLWDAQVEWSLLNPSLDNYDWTNLDNWLDVIAQHLPRDVIYTFGWTPCWDAVTCVSTGSIPNGSSAPPKDLTASGSATFNAFVTALVSHCSAKGNCVKDLIKYWEMWNEPNNSVRWSGTETQLYQMVAAAVPIIKSNISDAKVLTPPAAGGDSAWMQTWINLENSDGRLSDIYSFHLYLLTGTPEDRFPIIQKMIETKNGTPGWASTPWWNTETNFQNAPYYSCATTHSAADCTGQVVRWQLLHSSNGAANLSWYYFDTTIGQNASDAAAYYQMMKWMVGSEFVAPCSVNGTLWSCQLTLATGNSAQILWNTSPTCSNGGCTEDVSSTWTSYQDLTGADFPITNGTISVGVMPIMLTTSTP
jgi:IPT/TIG domain